MACPHFPVDAIERIALARTGSGTIEMKGGNAAHLTVADQSSGRFAAFIWASIAILL